ncbi:MAG TPA: P22 phage major capsid protein family protein [Vitreimonas sp.]|nr:P22 phage major capsid protein family protein [Vitreimonas sp.]
MPENVLNNTTNAVFIPTLIANKALGRFSSYLNLGKTVARSSDYVTAQVGQVIQVPKRGTLSANDKTAGNEYTKQNPTATNVSVTLNKHKEVTIAIDDVTKVLENQNTLDGYAEDAAIALAEAVEDELASLHSSLTNTVSFDATSSATKKASLLALRKRFVDNKVPKVENKYLYVDPSVMNELLEEADFTQQQTIGQAQNTIEGRVMRLYGFDIFESQSVKRSGSPGSLHNLAYTRDAFVLASRPLPQVGPGLGTVSTVVNSEDVGLSLRVNMRYDGSIGAHIVTLDLLFGVAVLDTRRVVELESF